MITELLDIQPQELNFIFELKKESLCSVRLINKSDHHVAFKVKTTSPKKYCVRPNTGVVKPKSKYDFTVTMQAQRSAPPEMICKDKFLVQSTVVPAGTINEDITASIFSKDGKYVEESKLRVILVSPANSPVLSPINGKLKQVPAYEASVPRDQIFSGVESLTPPDMVPSYEASVLDDQVLNGVKASVQCYTVTEDVQKSKIKKDELDPTKDKELKATRDVEELKLVKEIEKMNSKLSDLVLKLSEAEVTISKFTEERRLTAEERESLRHELTFLRSKMGLERVQEGFPFLFVVTVALASIMLGYLLHN